MESSILAIALVAVVAFLVYRERQHSGEQTDWRMERKDLLDRLMAQSFAQYKQAAIFEKVAPQVAQQEQVPDLGIEDVGN